MRAESHIAKASTSWILASALIASAAIQTPAQSGRPVTSSRRTTVINVIAERLEDPSKPRRLLTTTDAEEAEKIIGKHELEFYDGGVVQRIEAFVPDATPARIVVLMDNSATLQADVQKLASVPAAFAPEIYEGDKVMVIGYDLKPEIITEFTDQPDHLQSTLALLRKSDTPHLFDALNVVMEDVLRPAIGLSKRIVVVVGDGLDRGSRIKFDQILSTLQDENITVYAIQIRDRTRGALRKDAPKAAEVLEQLTAGTGGKTFQMDGDVKLAVKQICDELRNSRYQLTYYPEGINSLNKRRLLLTATTPAISLRYKASHPPHGQ